MIAIDTRSIIAYLSGEKGRDVDAVDFALEQKQAVLPPGVLSELLSDPGLPKKYSALFKELPLLSISEEYLERAGILRSKILAKGLKARLADTLIAQSCLDHDVALISRDEDFHHFVRIGGLNLFLQR